jgi:hypothetical protein
MQFQWWTYSYIATALLLRKSPPVRLCLFQSHYTCDSNNRNPHIPHSIWTAAIQHLVSLSRKELILKVLPSGTQHCFYSQIILRPPAHCETIKEQSCTSVLPSQATGFSDCQLNWHTSILNTLQTTCSQITADIWNTLNYSQCISRICVTGLHSCFEETEQT